MRPPDRKPPPRQSPAPHPLPVRVAPPRRPGQRNAGPRSTLIGLRGLAPALYGGSGFIAGAVFWHLVGFWNFVDQALRGPEGPRARVEQVQLPDQAPADVSVAPPALRQLSPSLAVRDCSLFPKARDGSASAIPCPVNAAALPEGGNEARGDLLAGRSQPAPASRRAAAPARTPAWNLSVTAAD